MIYEYECADAQCAKRFDVVKPVAEMTREERCPACAGPSARQFVPSRVSFTGTKVQHAEYNPAFGKVIRNKRHRQYEAEKRGMVEIGNDFKAPERIHEKHDREREERRDARYEQALKEVI